MKYCLATLVMMLVWFPTSLTARAEDEIGEEYIVKSLDGETKASLAVAPLGFAFSMDLSRFSEGTRPTGRQTTPQDVAKEEEFHKKLIPVGRALASEALGGCRFAVSVSTNARVPGNHDGSVSLTVAEEIKQFLTTSFAIAADRVIVQRMEAPLSANDVGAESTSVPRWHVEITRLE